MGLFGVATVTVAAACSATTGATAGSMPSSRVSSPDQAARADSVRHSYTPADVEFMTGMIHHHGQALVMARMAPTHGASGSLQVLAERIISGQNDEIALMQQWLRDRNEPVPEPAPADMAMTMHGDDHAMHMPGMLSDEQLEKLDAARGGEFDRLFLTYMIQHHQGALTMVNELFSTYGAGQGDAIFRLASDIGADQASEIARMRSMLREIMFETVNSP
ncbi:MAG TPA: DUF305 domain-containing protein [Gemmatimonadota bacterium]|nr:DUF305 domain-containing protein [Gemmatimonadota bacterium]